MASTDALERKRLRFLFTLFTIVLVALVVFRLGYWMIIKADWLKQKASVQWIRELPIEPQRGNIEDRNGNILAASVTSNTVVLHPKTIKEEELDDLVNALHDILGIDRETIEKKALKTDYSVVWLKRQISQEQSQQIVELGSGGVSLAEDKKRYYPLGNFLTQVLGFTSVDGEGLEGIESRFDNILHGTPGSESTETDRDGHPLPGTASTYEDPIEGNNLRLTIDLAIQSYTEQAMEQCINDTGAKAVSAIVMDCNTGEILALVNKPDFDNNAPPRNDMELLRELTKNTAISYSYEPGNIFGIVTAAAALDSGSIDYGFNYDCDKDYEVDGRELTCWSTDGHGSEDLYGIFENGCNLAFADISLKCGLNPLYDYIYKLGFGQESGIKLYGESEGDVISPKYITNYKLARIGYGQGISVTSTQMGAAISALVNGGHYVKPYIVKRVVSPEGEIIESYGSEITQSVLSYETSDGIRELLRYAAKEGNAASVKIGGYEIGGFAGTAQKYDATGTIIEGSHIATFAAAAPIDDPRIVVYIMVDEPEDHAQHGAVAAAPYGKMILEEALPYLSIMPDGNVSGGTVEMPDIIELTLSEAKSKLSQAGIEYEVLGYGGDVVGQYPKAGDEIANFERAFIVLEKVDDANESLKVEVPSLWGMGSVEADKALAEVGLYIKIKGVGSEVTDQYPWEGESAYVGDVVTVTFGYPPKDEQQTE